MEGGVAELVSVSRPKKAAKRGDGDSTVAMKMQDQVGVRGLCYLTNDLVYTV